MEWPRLALVNLWSLPQLQIEEENRDTDHVENSCAITTCKNVEVSISNVIPKSRFSSLEKLLRITSIVLKFIKCLKRNPNVYLTPLVSTEDLQKAQKLWILHLQEVTFHPEIKHLRHGEPMVTRNKNLNLFLDNNTIRSYVAMTEFLRLLFQTAIILFLFQTIRILKRW